jgi:hypothetical protein
MGICEKGNETLGSVTGVEFLKHLFAYLLLKEGLYSMELVG